MGRGSIAVFLALCAIGCTVEPIDLEARECPCVHGWVCDEVANVCVPATAGSDGGAPIDAFVRDGGVDAGVRLDAGEGDDSGAPPIDSGPRDSGPRDSGPPDSGPPDSGPPPSRCATDFAGRLFCDGFETGDTSLWDGEEIEGGFGSATVVTDTVYMGDNALRVQGDPGSGYAGLGKVVFPASGMTDQWFRGYYYFPSANGFGAEVNGMAETGLAYDIVVAVNGSSSNFHTHSWPTNHRVNSMTAIPADTWTCIELHVHFDATAGAIQLYFDDVLVVEGTMLDTTVPRGLSLVIAGFTWKDTTSTNVVYVDEIVADTARIGCD